MNTPETAYRPDFVLPPGETLREHLSETQTTETDFAHRFGFSAEQVGELLDGKMLITPTLAAQLATLTQMPAHFWLKLEENYQNYLFQNQNKTPLLQPEAAGLKAA